MHTVEQTFFPFSLSSAGNYLYRPSYFVQDSPLLPLVRILFFVELETSLDKCYRAARKPAIFTEFDTRVRW